MLLMAPRHRHPTLPRRRRVADPSSRTIRIGRAVWQARLALPNEYREPPVRGREYVRLQHGEACRLVPLPTGEFERMSNYRLRSLIMGLDREEKADGIA
jgi:hypothetical protein